MDKACILWFALVLLAWGSTPIFEKMGVLKVDASLFLFMQAVVISVVLGCYCFSKVRSGTTDVSQLDLQTLGLVLIVAIIGGVVGEWSFLKLIASTDTSRAVALTSAYPLVTLVVSVIVLGEQITLGAGCGALMVVLGTSLLLYSGGAS